MPAFISAEELHEFDDIIKDGWLTYQEWKEPPQITVRRRSDSGWDSVLTVTPITVDLSSTMFTGNLSGSTEAVSEVVSGGTMRLFTPANVQRDDRFKIDNDTYVVGLVELDNANHSTVLVNFTMLEGKANGS